MNDSLGVVEFTSIPAGYRLYNRILKDVQLSLFRDMIVAPARFIIMLKGSYAAIEHAVEWAVHSSAEDILDYSIIGAVHDALRLWLGNGTHSDAGTDIGLFETETLCAGIELTNRLLHGAPVGLLHMNWSTEMHGRCLIAVSGSVSSIQTALEYAGGGALISNVEPTVLRSITANTGDCNG